jgi:hypothetical protein
VATRHRWQSVSPALTGDLLLGQAAHKAWKSYAKEIKSYFYEMSL